MTALLPRQPYVAVGATTLAKAAGAMDISSVLGGQAAGASTIVADGTQIVSEYPEAVTVSAGALLGTCGQFSLLAGANAAARRILSTNTTTSAPTLATDGYPLSGAGLVILDFTHAGAVTMQVYTYSATSGLWMLDTSLGTSGSIAMGGSGVARIEVDYRGLDRIAVVCSVNGGSSAVQVWGTGVPVIYS